MKRMLLTIAYDGTAFHGWQVQPNGITVQETLQNALERLLGTRPAVTGLSLIHIYALPRHAEQGYS